MHIRVNDGQLATQYTHTLLYQYCLASWEDDVPKLLKVCEDHAILLLLIANSQFVPYNRCGYYDDMNFKL